MAIPKVMGIETEWSVVIAVKNEYEPAKVHFLEAMIDVIKKYFQLPLSGGFSEIENIERISAEERKDLERVIRDPESLFAPPVPRYHNLLPNGARFYIDGSHIEYSTPECLSAKTLVAADRAGEAILGLAQKSVNRSWEENRRRFKRELRVYKDNSDRKGHSYGCHENYLVSRETFDGITSPSRLDVGYFASYLVVRQIFCGAGKMGMEKNKIRSKESLYQISQRADFIQELLSFCTTDRRGIINTRDEPLADRKRFGRLHVIVGDANMSEFSTYLKMGITSIILKMIEDHFLDGDDILVINPVPGIKLVSQDLTCRKPVLETMGGKRLSSLNLNEEFLQRAQDYFSQVCQPSSEEEDLLRKWEETLSDFQTGNEERLRQRIDWKIKQGIFNHFLEAHGISWEDIGRAVIRRGRQSYKVIDQLFAKDILYHNIDRERGLYWAHKEAGEIEEIVTRDDVLYLIKNPPSECRSYFRGRCLAKFFESINMADWNEIVFRGTEKEGVVNEDFSFFAPLLTMNLLNPIWGGKEDTEQILDEANNYQDLLSALQKLSKIRREE
jgi:proteasome accessory factor A